MNKFLPFLLTLFLLYCGAKDVAVQQEIILDYDLLSDRIIAWDDIFNQEEEYYVVYFFSETCGHCTNIKKDIISYYLKGIEPMFFVKNPKKEEYYASSSYNLIGIDNSTDLRIYGVPGLLEIEEKEVLNYHFGEKQILSYLIVQQK